ncbi:MAG: TetR/AcrR family transcriptional regulator [Coriobacteriia bacterium]|nr:TetR/AcrR family transcriptional regulator [Coriobacteriia bacterium]
MTPRSDEQNERVRQQQQATIREAAARLFARRGLMATRIADIAVDAGVSSGLVHHYFGTKNQLFGELVDGVLINAPATTAAALEMDVTPGMRLRHVVETMLLGVRHAPHLFMLVVQAQSSEGVPEEVRARVAHLGEEGIAGLVRLIADAQESGEVRPGDPTVLAHHLGAFIQGLAIAVTFAGGATDEFPDADIVLGMLGMRKEG